MCLVKRIGFLIISIYCMNLSNIELISCKQSVCQFNKLCICANYTRLLSEMTCIGVNVRLSELPDQHYYRIRIMGAPDIAVIENTDFKDIKSLSSFTLSRTRLSSVESSAFAHSGVVQTLTTLELSNSELREFPTSALVHLHRLQWLSLRGNQIEEIKSKDLKDIKSLRSLLLSDNSLSVVPAHTFEGLPSLEFLDLDDNMITRIEGTPFPLSLTTLSLSNCLLQEVPFESMANLVGLQIIQLRGNLIKHLPQFKFSLLNTENLQLLDLSHNIISSISSNVFTPSGEQLQNQNPYNPLKQENSDNSEHISNALKYSSTSNANTSHTSHIALRIKDLHLDFNFIQSLPSAVFGHISCERLSLSNNRITSSFISEQAFDGPIKYELKALDLNYNLIDTFPNALKSLSNVTQILLKNNRLKYIDENAFSNCGQSLQVLDLSRNQLSHIPSLALQLTKTLIRLSLYGNSISKVDDNHLGEWSQTLLSLSLSKNGIKYISRDAFRYAKNLRELRLAGNNILEVSPNLLIPLRALELLDLSDSLNYGNSRHVIQSVAKSVKWLQLDYNGLKYSPISLPLKSLKALIHLDLQNNQIEEIGENEFNANLNISAVIVSHNRLSIVKSQAFSHLAQLENIGLYLNQIKSIESKAFESLPKLKTIILSKNFIQTIERKAFYNLSENSASLSILLDENRLKCFSADSFASDMTFSQNSLQTFLYINVSHNEIRQLSGCAVEPTEQIYINENKSVSGDHPSKQTVNVRVLDLSHNQIEDIPLSFIDRMCQSLHSLHLNHNRLTAFPISVLHGCPQVQILILSNNLIVGMPSTPYTPSNYSNQTFVSDLQVLSLRDNRINCLNQWIPIFEKLTNLRVLDLSLNLINKLPEKAFVSTIISRLYLSNNNLSNINTNIEKPFDSENNCFGVKSSLKYLDLSHNYLNSVPIEVKSCENLIEVKLTNNVIPELAMRSVTKFISLRQIDLSNNPIKKIDNKSLLFEPKYLNTLKLNNISISILPIFNLAYLAHLELSQNMISLIDPQSFSKSRNIRYLDLSRNQLQDVPRYLWKYMTKLHTLLLQYNPIDILDTSSFEELKNLRHLDIRGLNLQYIDTRLLHNHR